MPSPPAVLWLMEGSSGPHGFATGSEPHCPSPGTHHRQAGPPPWPGAAGIWVQITPTNLAWPPHHQHGGARSGLPPLPPQAEHDPNGEAFSKTKLCKTAFSQNSTTLMIVLPEVTSSYLQDHDLKTCPSRRRAGGNHRAPCFSEDPNCLFVSLPTFSVPIISVF